MRRWDVAGCSGRRQSAAGWLRICPAVAGLAAFVIALGLPQVGHAQDRGHGWHGDIGHFHERDLGRWRGGGWRHALYGGRFGWWWVVPGLGWYYYAAPIYPYPDPYLPAGAPPPVPTTPFWYYCGNPPGYYPYVPQCYGSWEPVSAQ